MLSQAGLRAAGFDEGRGDGFTDGYEAGYEAGVEDSVEAFFGDGGAFDTGGSYGSTYGEDDWGDEYYGVYYENCDAARDAGAAPVYEGESGYAPHLDRDGDGIGCEDW